jgi:hypothetical protein
MKLKRKFLNRMKDKWYRDNVIAITIAFVLISFLSIGYSVLSQNLNVQGDLVIRADKEIRITRIENTYSSCGYDVYNAKYSEDTITINGDMPQLNCYLLYDVTINNNTISLMEVTDIEEQLYNNSDILYEFIDMEIGTVIPAAGSKTFQIKFYYDPGLIALPSSTEISSVFKFSFGYSTYVRYNIDFVQEGLVLLFDARNNSGHGYDSNYDGWVDLIGTNDGTLLGNPTWGKNYLEFDGVDDKVSFAGNISERYTIISTFQADLTHNAPYQRIYSDSPFPSLLLQISGLNKMAWLYGHGKDIVFPNSVKLHGLIQTAMTFDGTEISLYVNGEYVSSIASTTNAVSTLTAYLGGREDLDRQFKGKIYNFMIYDRVLTNSEITSNYNADVKSRNIPIRTLAHLNKIGSGEIITVDNTDYLFGSSMRYVVEENLSFSYPGIWQPNINSDGSIYTYDKIITITNTLDNSIHYYQNQLYVTEDNAIKDGLVLHYDTLNNTGSGYSSTTTTWKDLKGNNDGTIFGSAVWSANALNFDGIDDRVEYIGNITPNYSFVVTVKPELNTPHPRIFAENPFPSIYIHSTNKRISFYGQGLDSSFSPSYIPSTLVPTYIVVTYDGQKIKLYVDGIKIGELSTTIPPTSTAIAYLGSRDTNDRQYEGQIYDFMIYDRVLSDFEIEKSYITNKVKYGN